MNIKYRKDLHLLLPDNPITVELGVAEGNFSFDICNNWKPSKHYLVDNWSTILSTTGDGNFPQEWHDMNYYAAVWKMYEHKDKAVFLRGITWEMAKQVPDNSVDIVYVDAGHYYDAVAKDIQAWFPKIKEGGIMAFHDYLMPQYGVMQSVENFCRGQFKIHIIPENRSDDSGAWIRKESAQNI